MPLSLLFFSGTKVLVRCIKLLKPYGRKNAGDFDEDEDDDDTEERGQVLPSEGRIMERDVISQAYHIGQFELNYVK